MARTFQTTDDDRIHIGRVLVYRRGKKRLWTASFHAEGGHIRQSLRTPDSNEAILEAGKINASLEVGAFKKLPAKKTITQAIEEFLLSRRGDGNRERTLELYRRSLLKFAAFAKKRGVMTVSAITVVDYDAYRTGLIAEKLSQSTVYDLCNHLRMLLNWCLNRDLLVKNPLNGIRLKKPTAQSHIAATLPQVIALLGAADEDLVKHLAVLAYTGMRIDELRHLRPQDVDLTGGWIHIRARDGWAPKTHHDRSIPIHPKLFWYLKAPERSNNPWFFCSLNSESAQESDAGLRRRFNALLEKLDMPIGRKQDGLTFHSFRRFFETTCQMQRVPQPITDMWMGHTGDRSMSTRYFTMTPEISQQTMRQVMFDLPADALTLHKGNPDEAA